MARKTESARGIFITQEKGHLLANKGRTVSSQGIPLVQKIKLRVDRCPGRGKKGEPQSALTWGGRKNCPQ